MALEPMALGAHGAGSLAWRWEPGVALVALRRRLSELIVSFDHRAQVGELRHQIE